MAENVRYEEMLPHEVVAARQAKPAAYLPIGTIEWHGRHNPLGLDTLKAHALCVRAAEAGGGLALPPLWWGEQREIELMEVLPDCGADVAAAMALPAENFAPGYMGGKTVEDQVHAYHDLLYHCYYQIASLGFKALFVMCGHYPLSGYADFTAGVFMRRNAMRIHAAAEHEVVADLAEELGLQPGDHAARWETSLLMALRPGLTDLSQLPEDAASADLLGIRGREDPRQASAKLGRRAVDAIVRRMVDKTDAALAAYQGD